MKLADDAVSIHYTVVFGQLPALRELHLADSDGDGVTSQTERDAYAERLAPGFGDQLRLTVDGAAVPLRAIQWTTSLPTEQGGFSLRLDVDFSGSVALAAGQTIHKVEFTNQNYSGRFGWQEIAVEPSANLSVFDTNAFGSSLTAGLTEAVASMPANGPLSERAVQMRVVNGKAPAGAELIPLRAGTTSPNKALPDRAKTQATAGSESSWLARETRRLIDLISDPHVSPHVLLLAMVAAAVLGALHAFSPGHGKTVVGAYLIGSRGTLRHAIFLGATVTITHTLGVFAVGLATMFASRFVVPETLFPILGLVSGLLILGMGVVLFVQRYRAAHMTRPSAPTTYKLISPLALGIRRPVMSVLTQGAGPSFSFTHAHAHGARMHHHGGHHHHGGLTHSHGGVEHTHLPPGASGEAITWRSLLALGISGGLVPCPSAMVLLLAAVALNKTAYGLILVVAFSVGLATTLTVIGLAFLYARNRIRAPDADARWPQWLPVASAAAITVVGAFMCYGAIVSWSP